MGFRGSGADHPVSLLARPLHFAIFFLVFFAVFFFALFVDAGFAPAVFFGAAGFAVFTGFSATGFSGCSAAFWRAALLANCASRIARS